MTMTLEPRSGAMRAAIVKFGVKFGLGYGAVAAMILSYSVNKSILWMLIDGWFSWLYVIFFALFKS